MDELKTIFPGQTVELSDGPITVSPLTFGQLPKAMALSRNIAGPIMATLSKSADASAIMSIVADGGEDFIDLMALGTGIPRAKFNTMSADDGVKLASAFLEVNLDFFTQKVLPLVQKMLTDLNRPGPTSS